jgi:short subunit dehydrogenase-like uncharacterized protein
MPAHHRRFDLVVFGATSFVGRIVTARLVDRLDGDDTFIWAIAGRNADRLAQVAAETGADVEHVVADAADVDAMRSLAASARVVASTVGPYALYGSPLVDAAAASGTDYCDLTGEPHWMRAMIDAHQGAAETSGARIVHACGFDSIPSDLGVWFTQRVAFERFGEPCTSISLRVRSVRGSASGGTIASGLNLIDEAARDPELRRILGNPYALAPDGLRSGPKQPKVTVPHHDAASGQWVAPFIMAATNTQVVQRTHALLGRPWGDDFLYDEAIMTGDGPIGAMKAAAVGGGSAAFAGLAAFGPSRRLLGLVLPEPGDGPSPEQQEAGSFDVRLYGETAGGDTVVTKVTGDRDPGYGSTARMLVESALAFSDRPRSTTAGGFWTPATAFGDVLIDRLVEHAGLAFDVVDDA